MPLTTPLLLAGLLLPGFNGCEDEPDPSRVPKLIRLLSSKEAKVRAEAAEELGTMDWDGYLAAEVGSGRSNSIPR